MAGLSSLRRMKRLASRSTWWRTLPDKSTHAVNLSPLEEAQTKELAAGVERALAALPPKEAQVIRRGFGVSVETPQKR